MRNTIFKTVAEMPPPHNINREVVRTAQTMTDYMLHNSITATIPADNNVKNLPAPKRGCHY